MNVRADGFDVVVVDDNDCEVAVYEKSFDVLYDDVDDGWIVIDAECVEMCKTESRYAAVAIADALNAFGGGG